MIESALDRPRNLANYSDPDAAALAACYAYGIAKNHGFMDGNKRTAWVLARLFLLDNGLRLKFDPVDAIRTMESVAEGSLDEDTLADWFRQRILTLEVNSPLRNQKRPARKPRPGFGLRSQPIPRWDQARLHFPRLG